jgi:hypothetical protein
LAWGFPGQPYFLEEAQELAITATAKNNKMATALFFILGVNLGSSHKRKFWLIIMQYTSILPFYKALYVRPKIGV